jgi:hypothetical protein
MKYEYEIKKNHITEFENDLMSGKWGLEFLKKNDAFFLIDGRLQCFLRTREWCLENHPELLL